jgi:hypothetical protein
MQMQEFLDDVMGEGHNPFQEKFVILHVKTVDCGGFQRFVLNSMTNVTGKNNESPLLLKCLQHNCFIRLQSTRYHCM